MIDGPGGDEYRVPTLKRTISKSECQSGEQPSTMSVMAPNTANPEAKITIMDAQILGVHRETRGETIAYLKILKDPKTGKYYLFDDGNRQLIPKETDDDPSIRIKPALEGMSIEEITLSE